MCKDPEQQGPYVKRLAKDLVQFLALFLAETVAELLQAALAYPCKGLVDASNAPLLPGLTSPPLTKQAPALATTLMVLLAHVLHLLR